MDHVTHVSIQDELMVELLLNQIVANRRQWLQHTQRMEAGCLLKEVVAY